MPPLLDPVRVLRARARRAHLDRSGGDAVAVTRSVAALHGTDPCTIFLSVHARQPLRPLTALVDELRGALERERRLLRLLGMRRTIHVIDRDLAPAVMTLATHRLHADRVKNATQHIAEAGAASLDLLSAQVLEALGDEDLESDVLAQRVPDLGRRFLMGPGKAYAAEMSVGRFVLEAMGTAGQLVRARAPGSWKASRNTWARLDRWSPGLGSPPDKLSAYSSLARAYLAAFGPATVDDLAWWAGLPKGEIKSALAALGPECVEVQVRGWPGARFALSSLPLEDDGPPLGVALLPALDPSGMCWTDRSPFLAPKILPPLFDYSGNIAPTVWLDGRIIGGWACRKDGRVVFEILDEDQKGAQGAVAEEAQRLQEALGGEVVSPRFPTPLTKALVS